MTAVPSRRHSAPLRSKGNCFGEPVSACLLAHLQRCWILQGDFGSSLLRVKQANRFWRGISITATMQASIHPHPSFHRHASGEFSAVCTRASMNLA